MRLSPVLLLAVSGLITFVSGHARIKTPTPLNAPPEDPTGNAYNAPLVATGAQFPCKNLHTQSGIDKSSKQTWTAGSQAYFEILGHVVPYGEGALAAHSGGSCQASLSFDNGASWKVLHSYHGGCPRDVALNSNMAGPNQTFNFDVPSNCKSGPALFAWTWTAVTGNRDEFYMDCASVTISGSGSSTLSDYPDMFVGDMNIPGQIATGECRSTAGNALLYPNPGPASRVTVTTVSGIPFKGPSPGNCVAPGSGKGTAPGPPASSVYASVPAGSSSAPPAPTYAVPTSVAVPVPVPATTVTYDDGLYHPSSKAPVPVYSSASSSYVPPPVDTPTYPASTPTYPASTPTYPASTPTYPVVADTPTQTPVSSHTRTRGSGGGNNGGNGGGNGGSHSSRSYSYGYGGGNGGKPQQGSSTSCDSTTTGMETETGIMSIMETATATATATDYAQGQGQGQGGYMQSSMYMPPTTMVTYRI